MGAGFFFGASSVIARKKRPCFSAVTEHQGLHDLRRDSKNA